MEKRDLSQIPIGDMTPDDWRELAEQVEAKFHDLAPKGTSIVFSITDDENARCLGGCFSMPSAIRAISEALKIASSVFDHNLNKVLGDKDTEGLHKLTTSPMILIPVVRKGGSRAVTRTEAEEIVKQITGLSSKDGLFVAPIPEMNVNISPLEQKPIIKPKNKDIH